MNQFAIGQKIYLDDNGVNSVGIVTELIKKNGILEGLIAKFDHGYLPFRVIDDKPYPIMRDQYGRFLSEDELVEIAKVKQVTEQ